jgi:hypothetical protein
MWMIHNLLIAALILRSSYSLEEMMSQSTNDFALDSAAGRALLTSAKNFESQAHRELEDEDWNKDIFLGKYAIKFQSCHSRSEWNGSSNSDSSADSKVVMKNLVTFRLCNRRTCSNTSSKGCVSQYGDYVVDMNTFVYYYLSALNESNSQISEYCLDKCGGANYCYYGCFSEKGGTYFEDSNINPFDYAQCAAYGDYYIGPVCSSSGDQINLGVFSDSSCSTLSSCDESCFYDTYSFNLPYSSQSIIQDDCLSCSVSSDSGSDSESRCTTIYHSSGKCESKLPIDYPNNSACTFIEDLKISKYGSIMGMTMKNKGASVAIGLLTFTTILLGFYANFVWKKFQRAKLHLSNENYVALDR